MSCLHAQKDSWDVDYQATLNALQAAQQSGAAHFVLLSAICVQKPLLVFQKAKLKFEAALQVHVLPCTPHVFGYRVKGIAIPYTPAAAE